MTTSSQMFLLAAQELNFSRAAERAYVTPQCLSDHIKRIEERYAVTLFTRKPHLRLTAEGETMLRYLTRIRALEENMENELADVGGGTRGILRLGMPLTRGSVLIPRIIMPFRQRFPNVEVDIQLTDTKTLSEFLLGGKLDIFLGVDAPQHALFSRELLGYEPLYLVISRRAMERRFETGYETVRADFLRRGVQLSLLQGISFVQGHSISTTTRAVEQLLLRQRVNIRIPVRVSSFDLVLNFCRTEHCATICSRSHLRHVIDLADPSLEVYAIRDAQVALPIELISHRDAQPLAYRTAFFQLLSRVVLEEDAAIRTWLVDHGIIAL